MNNPNRAGSEWQFPGRLHDMLTYVEKEGLQSIISWVQDGRAFIIHDPDKLVDILPQFFSQTKYRSFRRQLNMWHFDRVLCGPDRGAFEHPFFIKGRKALCKNKSRHSFKLASPKKLQIGIHDILSEGSKIDCDHSTSSFQEPTKQLTIQTVQLDKIASSSSLYSDASCTAEINNNNCFFADGDIVAFEGRHFHFVDLAALQI